MKPILFAILSFALVACTPAASPNNDAGDAQADAAVVTDAAVAPAPVDAAVAPAPAAVRIVEASPVTKVAAPVDAGPKPAMVPDLPTKKK